MPPSAEKISIYKAGSPSKSGFLVKGAKIYVEWQPLPPLELELDNLLVGVVELFLGKGDKVPPRLFSLSADEGAIVEAVSFSTVLEMTRRLHFGISANRFLAILIDKTNKLLRETIQTLPPEWKIYQERAVFFVTLVQKLSEVWQRTQVAEYGRLAGRKMTRQLYEDGIRFGQERAIGRLTLSPSSKFAAEYFGDEKMLCKAGEQADCMYALLKGSVLVLKDEKVIATISQPGEAFGELSFFIQGKRTADLVATKGSAVYRIQMNQLPAFHDDHPDMFIEIAKTLAARLEANIKHLNFYNPQGVKDKRRHIENLNGSAGRELVELVEDLKRCVRVASEVELTRLINWALNEKVMREARG